MASRIILVTPTGDRQELFALCEKWMARQTVQWDDWYIVDDGKTPTKPTLGQHYIRREPCSDDPPHTLVKNLYCLPPLSGRVFFIEDDDHYTSNHIETHLKYDAPLIGQRSPQVYKVQTKQFRKHRGTGRGTALAASSVEGDWTKHLEGDPFLDLRLYANMPFHLYNETTVTGMKNFPCGRPGVCRAHQPKNWGSVELKEVIGNDAVHYSKFF